jgi:hypothetical protein
LEFLNSRNKFKSQMGMKNNKKFSDSFIKIHGLKIAHEEAMIYKE